jgi:hypothetical protein
MKITHRSVENVTMLDVIYGVSQAWSSVNPVMLVQSWRKLLPDTEQDDLQGFPSKETSRCKVYDGVCHEMF